MKFRKDFVTNSSSSSFIISKSFLDEDQIEAIREHSYLGAKLDFPWYGEKWSIRENEEFITGYTDMDNFDMYKFMKIIGINTANVTWGEYSFDLDRFRVPKENVSNREEETEELWRYILHDKKARDRIYD